MIRVWKSVASILTVTSLLAACVERKEHLVISPDASVLWQVSYRSDSLDDLLQGDAVPTAAGGWIVSNDQTRDDDGKITYIINAQTVFNAKKHHLPEGYGPASDLAADICLKFPTAVTFEKRRDGVYCHFSRNYQPRAWAPIARLREQMVEEPLKGMDGDPAKWTPDQRLIITQALASFEVEKNIVFTRAAWLEALPNKPQDGYLAIRDQLHALLLTLDYPRLANLLVPAQAADQEKALTDSVNLETRQLKEAIIARIGETAQKAAGLDGASVDALLAACDRQRRTFEVTEDLDDDGFEITVDMPGVIVASNAEGINGRSATWKFKGDELHDRPIELLATSKVGP